MIVSFGENGDIFCLCSYEITGAPIKGASLRLVVPTQIGDAPRLLVMDAMQADRILRVITLENIPKK